MPGLVVVAWRSLDTGALLPPVRHYPVAPSVPLAANRSCVSRVFTDVSRDRLQVFSVGHA